MSSPLKKNALLILACVVLITPWVENAASTFEAIGDSRQRSGVSQTVALQSQIITEILLHEGRRRQPDARQAPKELNDFLEKIEERVTQKQIELATADRHIFPTRQRQALQTRTDIVRAGKVPGLPAELGEGGNSVAVSLRSMPTTLTAADALCWNTSRNSTETSAPPERKDGFTLSYHSIRNGYTRRGAFGKLNSTPACFFHHESRTATAPRSLIHFLAIGNRSRGSDAPAASAQRATGDQLQNKAFT